MVQTRSRVRGPDASGSAKPKYNSDEHPLDEYLSTDESHSSDGVKKETPKSQHQKSGDEMERKSALSTHQPQDPGSQTYYAASLLGHPRQAPHPVQSAQAPSYHHPNPQQVMANWPNVAQRDSYHGHPASATMNFPSLISGNELLPGFGYPPSSRPRTMSAGSTADGFRPGGIYNTPGHQQKRMEIIDSMRTNASTNPNPTPATSPYPFAFNGSYPYQPPAPHNSPAPAYYSQVPIRQQSPRSRGRRSTTNTVPKATAQKRRSKRGAAATISQTALKGGAIDETKPSPFDLTQGQFQAIGEYHGQEHASGHGNTEEMEKSFGEP
ncbi:hypothetical protein AB5N19_14007 [Seiridium cardinale]